MMKRGRLVLVALASLLVAQDARAVTLLTEATAGRNFWGVSLLGEVELSEDETFLTVCYGSSRTAGTTSRSHQLCAGVDHLLDRHWLVSANVSWSPEVATQTPITRRLVFRSFNSSMGATVGVAYDTAGISDLELMVDGALSTTLYALPRQFVLLSDEAGGEPRVLHQVSARDSNLPTLRPSLGITALLGFATELSLRGSLSLYFGDPLTAGQITRDELEVLAGFAQTQARSRDLSDQLAQYLFQSLSGQLLQANATTGMPAAPTWFELRPGVAHSFGLTVRGEVTYTFIRYVPTQGMGHVLSTRWSYQPLDALRLWGALAVQRDLLPDAEGLSSVLATLGVQYTF